MKNGTSSVAGRIPKHLTVLLCVLAAACGELPNGPGTNPETPANEEPQPISEQADAVDSPVNILLILADDLGFSDLPPFGGEIRAPRLTGLAEQGTIFTNFHTAVKCNPTRAMLMTGIDNNSAATGPRRDYRLRTDVSTIAEAFRDAGYHTYITGKWDLGRQPESMPSARGFEKTFVLLPGAGRHFPDPDPSLRNDSAYRQNGMEVTLPHDFYSSINYTDRLIGFLKADREDDKPFLAIVSYTAPHYPLQAPREYIARYQGWYEEGYQQVRANRLAKIDQLGLFPGSVQPYPVPELTDWNSLSEEAQSYSARRMQIYAAMIELMDEQIGRLLDYLDARGIAENTLVFFMSDNGADATTRGVGARDTDDNGLENLGSATSYRTLGADWARVSSTPLRFFKTYPTEGGTRTPAIARLPGRVLAGVVNSGFFSVADIMPTLLDLAGVENGVLKISPESESTRGRSALDVLTNAGPAYGENDFAFHFYVEPRLGGGYARQGDWKLAWWKEDSQLSRIGLFNVRTDPGETTDLSQLHPDTYEKLWQAALQFADTNRVGRESFTPVNLLPE